MTTLISKWGNSLGLRIPKKLAEEIRVEDGDAVDISVQDGAIVVRPQRREYTIEELVAGITPKNRHAVVSWGKPVGKEVW